MIFNVYRNVTYTAQIEAEDEEAAHALAISLADDQMIEFGRDTDVAEYSTPNKKKKGKKKK